ncbi:MAG: energy transducer TonB [Terriglobales bacterium]
MSARKLTLTIVLSIAACSGVRAQQIGTVTVIDKGIKAVDFEDLKYPLLAQYAPLESEGVVVVRVNLDDEGKVVEAMAISGNDILIPDCLANVKKWRFQPNPAKTAVIVYNFRMLQGECKSASSVFAFQHPNFVTIVGCMPIIESSIRFIRLPHGGTVSDLDMKVLHFEWPRYPAIAKSARIQGVVVVQVSLDDKGNAVEAVAISGHPMLIENSLANAKKWRFEPNPQKTAVIVYNFSLLPWAGQDQVILEPPNFLTITAEPPTVQPAR